MNKLDTAILILPQSECKTTNSLFVTNRSDDNITSHKLVDTGIVGLNDVTIYPSGNVNLHVSSKILGTNYLNGISINTIEQLHSEITNKGIIDFSIDTLINSIVRRVDACSVMPMTQIDMHRMLDSFQLNDFPRNKYDSSRYGRKDNQGYGIKGKLSTRKIYCKFYDKYLDLQKASNKEFRNLVGYKWIEDNVKDKLRIETEYSTGLQKDLKKMLQITDKKVCLKHILNSKTNVLLSSIEQIMPKCKDTLVLSDTIKQQFQIHKQLIENPTLVNIKLNNSEFKKIAFYYYLLKEYKGDLSMVKEYEKKINPNNYRRKSIREDMLIAKKLYDSEHQSIEVAMTQRNSYLETIKTYLKHEN